MSNIDSKCVNAIRVLSEDAVQKAKSGSPGMPLGAAPIAYELWEHHMNHNPKNPKWINRDRFVLSSGHAWLEQIDYPLRQQQNHNLRLHRHCLHRKRSATRRGVRFSNFDG